MKKILMLVMGLMALADLSCFASQLPTISRISQPKNLLLERKGKAVSVNPLSKMKTYYRKQQIQEQLSPQYKRKQTIAEDINQLKSEGKTSEEIERIYMLARETHEAQVEKKSHNQLVKKIDEKNEAKNAYDAALMKNLPSQELVLRNILKKKEEEEREARENWRKDFQENRKTIEYRIAHLPLAIFTPTKPVVKLDFYTGKPTPVSSRPIITQTPSTSSNSLWNRFWRAFGY